MDLQSALVLAAISQTEYRSIVLVLAAASGAALLSRLHRRLVLPTVVVEIVLGILIGPEVLDLAEVNTYLTFLANFGLAFLFFFAGLEVIEKHVPRHAVVRGSIGWTISIALGLVVGVVLELAGVDAEWWVLGVALATTALGTLVPILIDSGVLGTPLGTAALGTGVAGEFWPIVVISVFLTSVYGAGVEVLLLLGFAALVLLAATVALRARPPEVLRVLQETVHTTGQAAVRLSVLTLAVLVFIAARVGLEFVLGALAAGLVVGLVLDSPDGNVVRMRLEGIGFGLLIPIYFVVTGMEFDIESLLTAGGLALAALFLALLFVVRGASSLLWARELERRSTVALAFFGATGLPLIVAIVDVAGERGAIADSVGAALIGAGMVSVLLFPLLGVRIAGEREPSVPAAPAIAEAGDEY
jgi:Kef-type K+ transport system membrane component KefB